MAQKDYGQQFGVMFVPRFGPNWQFTVAAGTGRHDILDAGEIGHYTDTAMPGEVGNTVYAAHRWTSGAPFDPIDKLVIGDAIVIQTPDGWYTYRFRTRVRAGDAGRGLAAGSAAGRHGSQRPLSHTDQLRPEAQHARAHHRVRRVRELHSDLGGTARLAHPGSVRLMYAALWRVLPGPAWVRILILLVLLAAVLYGLFWYVFPWVAQFINPQDATVGG
jgi:hypothetical protein